VNPGEARGRHIRLACGLLQPEEQRARLGCVPAPPRS
jgi:hypothetical protein